MGPAGALWEVDGAAERVFHVNRRDHVVAAEHCKRRRDARMRSSVGKRHCVVHVRRVRRGETDGGWVTACVRGSMQREDRKGESPQSSLTELIVDGPGRGVGRGVEPERAVERQAGVGGLVELPEDVRFELLAHRHHLKDHGHRLVTEQPRLCVPFA